VYVIFCNVFVFVVVFVVVVVVVIVINFEPFGRIVYWVVFTL
jgi:hypothetical protein